MANKQIVMFPPEVIALQRELSSGHHNTLCRVLHLIKADEERLAAIATHCDALLDGDYNKKQIRHVCERLLPLLIERREPPSQNIIVV